MADRTTAVRRPPLEFCGSNLLRNDPSTKWRCDEHSGVFHYARSDCMLRFACGGQWAPTGRNQDNQGLCATHGFLDPALGADGEALETD
jgi:hypothetical protein